MIQGVIASQGVLSLTPLQELKDSCVFAFNADTSGWVGNSYALEVGTGNLTRNAVNQTTGMVNQALHVDNNINNIAIADATLNAYEPLFFKDQNGDDTDYTISFWASLNPFTSQTDDSYFLDNRALTPRAAYLFLFRESDSKIIAVQQSFEGGSSKALNYFFSANSLLSNQFNHFVFKYNALNKEFYLKINNTNISVDSFTNNGFTKKGMVENNLFIGSSVASTVPLRGAIDAMHFFNGITTDEQDDILYNQGNGIQLF